LNVIPNDTTELIVRKGRVILSDDSHTKVKGGNKVVFSATNVSVAKLTKEEKKVQENIDNWSKERAETLAKANRHINDRMINSAFATFRDWDPFSRSNGLWFFNSRAGCYTFLPFSYGWGSPYGNSYSTAIFSPYFGLGYPRGGSWPQPGNTTNNGSPGGYTHPTRPVTTTPTTPTTNPSGSFGTPMGRRERPIDPDTGARMPHKNLEPSRPN
jgi:hypothetical protein